MPRGVDLSEGGPCPADCEYCEADRTIGHDMDASNHTGEAPDGIMGLCPRCVMDSGSFHYTADWHRQWRAYEAIA